jgi:uncharacterized protein YcbK (DUF882 family)
LDRARALPILVALTRSGSRLGIAGLLVLLAGNALQSAIAEGDTRTLTLHHVHTGEDLTITFKRDGHYVPSALKKLDWFMRDWRKAQETNMDPHLFDLLWQVYRESGATGAIDIICGYRSPGTNAMLRARSNGVARHSEHILGKAIDFFIPGVPLAKIRAIGLEMQRGGVGFYPTSGSPFVHMDVGLVRHWPTIPRQELVKIFPNGRTVHIPADGKPLRNYALALADVERHGNAPSERSLDAARVAGVIDEGQVQEAALIAEHQQQQQQPHTFIANLFGLGGSRDETETHTPAREQAHAPVRLASLSKPPVGHRAVPLPTARPQTIMTAHAKRKAPITVMQLAALTSEPEARNIWGDVVSSGTVTQPSVSPFDVAAADPPATGSAAALAYAPESDPTPVARVRPMGATVPRLPREATVLPSDDSTTVAVKPPMSMGGQRTDSPWLRAAMLTPNLTDFMTVTRLGHAHPAWLSEMLQKPSQAVLMSFSADPHLGMVTDRFTGHAVVFLATATFVPPTAVSLR